MALSEINCCQQRGNKHGEQWILHPKEEGPRVGLVIFSRTQRNRRFCPPPPWLVLPLNACVQIPKNLTLPPPPWKLPVCRWSVPNGHQTQYIPITEMIFVVPEISGPPQACARFGRGAVGAGPPPPLSLLLQYPPFGMSTRNTNTTPNKCKGLSPVAATAVVVVVTSVSSNKPPPPYPAATIAKEE